MVIGGGKLTCMSILCDSSIRSAVQQNVIGVDPEPTEIQYQPASLDLRLGDSYWNAYTDETYEDCDELVIEPNTFYLTTTEETISLPDDLSAVVTGRSSIGRKGLIIHTTAGWIDAGFTGEITLEVFNFNNEPVVLDAGTRIGQLVFFQMDAAADEPYGSKTTSKYQGQSGPTGSRLEGDE